LHVPVDDIDAFIFDLDGTVYLGDKLLPGARRVIEKLKTKGKTIRYLSNKPLQSRTSYARKLSRLGIPTKAAEVINSSLVLVRYLQRTAPGATIFCLGERSLCRELERAGFRLTRDFRKVDVVVLSFDRTFNYAKLNVAFQAIKRGAAVVATNPDRSCPVDGGEIPDCAAVIGAVEGCTGTKVRTIVGKPSRTMIREILRDVGTSGRRCAIVGDRLATDIEMGARAGLTTVLVLTGVTDRAALKKSSVHPHYVLDNIGKLIPKRGREPS